MSVDHEEGSAKAERTVQAVRERYGRIASAGSAGCCDGLCTTTAAPERLGYDHGELEGVPEGANLGLGCGAPIESLELRAGETVVDLGSGGGLDAFLAARKVGPHGTVIGIDMTPEMIERARANAARAGLAQVEFREGRLESLPIADGTVDAVTSNCVINLVPDKRAVFDEIVRVLKPGGRVVVSDIMLEGRLPEAVGRNLLAWVGCVAGAIGRKEYFEIVDRAGLRDAEVLRNVDYLAAAASKEDRPAWMDEAGIRYEELHGIVHSVTFRAFKRPD